MSNNNNNKMKGLLKGLRYISQIFDNEKEPEMQIGFPTDVKHVAHIGWDGPSVNSPSWMNEFKSPPAPAYASAPMNLNGEAKDGPNPVKWVSQDATRRSGWVENSPSRDSPELPKASRRQQSTSSANGATESPTREKVEKSRQRRSSKHSSREAADSPRQSCRSTDSNPGVDSPARNLPDIPKKSRRKKSKDGGGGSSRSRSRAQASPAYDQLMVPFSDPGEDRESTKSKSNDLNCQNKPIFDEADEIKGLIT